MLLEKNEDFREWIILGRRAFQARCPKVRGFKPRLPGSFGIPPIFLACSALSEGARFETASTGFIRLS